MSRPMRKPMKRPGRVPACPVKATEAPTAYPGIVAELEAAHEAIRAVKRERRGEVAGEG